MFIPGYALLIIALALIGMYARGRYNASMRIVKLKDERNTWRVRAEALPRVRVTLGLQNARAQHARDLWAQQQNTTANIDAIAAKISAYTIARPDDATLAACAAELTHAAHQLNAVNLDNVLTMMQRETAPYRKEWEEVQNAKARATTFYHL
ncbi:hypothetical protein DOC35_19370 [Salmonella enterica subsp. enterica]|nr:hypothetical protein [Salmonella enterica subsp. enterica]